MPEGAIAFAGALVKTGYLFQLIMGMQLISSLLLLANHFVPLLSPYSRQSSSTSSRFTSSFYHRGSVLPSSSWP